MEPPLSDSHQFDAAASSSIDTGSSSPNFNIDTNDYAKEIAGPSNIDMGQQSEAHDQPSTSIISNSPHDVPSSPTVDVAPQSPPQIADIAPQSQNRHPMMTRRKNNISKPKIKFNLMATSSTSIPAEPTTITQALKQKPWRIAMSDELDAFARNRTYDLVPRPLTANVVGCKWIYKNKFLPNGLLGRCKARLVAKGYNQEYGRDYKDTFSPVIKSTTLRLVLSLAVSKSWPITQLDVNNAFLQGRLTEEVFMEQPPGFVDADHPSYVCRLNKAVYGLKQAPRAWYTELQQFLVSLGFVNSLADTSLFVYRKGTDIVYLLVYVDDIVITGNNTTIIASVLSQLAERFSVKDAEDLNYFLGIEARRTKQGLHLSQRKYILDLLHRYNMSDAKPVTTPMASSPKLKLHEGTTLSDPTTYRQLVGSLQYLAFTRLDIMYAVNRLSQFMHKPTEPHWQAAKRILRYLVGTIDHGLFYSSQNEFRLHGFSDADWAGDSDDYISTNAFIIYTGSHPISWVSKKQKSVARSSTEAEYRAVANTASELRWICNLLTELGITLPTAPAVYCDNVGATFLCANPVFHSRMKHVALDYHFIRGQIQSGVLRVSHVNTHDQLADALTKPLQRARFIHLRDKIGVATPLHLEGAC